MRSGLAQVPSLAGRIGWFLHTQEGRRYLIRVPGVAFAPVGDADLAGVLNWALATYSPRELPADFRLDRRRRSGRFAPLDRPSVDRDAIVQGLVAARARESPDLLAFDPDRTR